MPPAAPPIHTRPEIQPPARPKSAKSALPPVQLLHSLAVMTLGPLTLFSLFESVLSDFVLKGT